MQPGDAALSSTEFRAIFASYPGMCLVLEPKEPFRILAATDALFTATKTSPDALMGQPLFDVFRENAVTSRAGGKANVVASLHRVIETGALDAMPLQRFDVLRKEGGEYEPRYWSVINAPLLDDGGELRFILHRTEDVTEWVLAKETSPPKVSSLEGEVFARARDLSAANEGLRSAFRQLEDANRALAAANAGLEGFASVVSHDMKEPVRATQYFIEEALSHAIDPSAIENIKRASDANQRLSRQLSRLLELSRASLEPVLLEPVTLGTLLSSEMCQGYFAQMAAEKHGDVRADGTQLSVLASSTLLSQALGNFILNALKHNPHPAPQVHVHGESTQGRAVIRIEDNGPGFPPALLDTFQRTNGSPPRSLQGGFGLAIARHSIERMGGTVRLGRSALGGASVTVTLDQGGRVKTEEPPVDSQAIRGR